MPKAYSTDLRMRVVAAMHAGQRNLPRRGRQLRHRPVHRWEVDPGAGAGATWDHGQGACAPRERASRPLCRKGRGLEVPETLLRAQLQEDDVRRRRAGTARRESAGTLDAPSGPDRSGTPRLPGRDLREDEHGAAQGLGSEGGVPARTSPVRPLEHVHLHRRSVARDISATMRESKIQISRQPGSAPRRRGERRRSRPLPRAGICRPAQNLAQFSAWPRRPAREDHPNRLPLFPVGLLIAMRAANIAFARTGLPDDFRRVGHVPAVPPRPIRQGKADLGIWGDPFSIVAPTPTRAPGATCFPAVVGRGQPARRRANSRVARIRKGRRGAAGGVPHERGHMFGHIGAIAPKPDAALVWDGRTLADRGVQP